MSQGSSTSSSPCYDDAAVAARSGRASSGDDRPAATDALDPLTRRLRDIYGAIAEEPVPESIIALLERLREH